jgi:uncharacterized membrane protein
VSAPLDVVRGYYAALDTGDADAIAAWAYERIEGRWILENGIDDGEQAVIEWTMTWRDASNRSGDLPAE